LRGSTKPKKRWLAAKPPAATIGELQTQLNELQHVYNTTRPHRLFHAHTPEHAYNATPKAAPRTIADTTHYRVRIDRLDSRGKVSLRRAGNMHHLGVRAENARKHVLLLIDETTATVTELTTGEVLSQHLINPERNYWPNTLKPAGRWPRE
jgi:hypothetical protein